MRAAEQREAPGAVWIFAVPAPGFAGECSEGSGLCCDKKGRTQMVKEGVTGVSQSGGRAGGSWDRRRQFRRVKY